MIAPLVLKSPNEAVYGWASRSSPFLIVIGNLEPSWSESQNVA